MSEKNDMPNLIFEGKVEKGEGIATGLGCPTANLTVEQGSIIPGLGVYTGEAELEGKTYPCVICINDGRTGARLKLEVHLLDECFDSLEGKFMTARMFEKLRGLVPWESDEQMKGLILKDLENARKWFDEHHKER